MEIRKNSICLKEPIYYLVWTYSLDSNKCGVQSVGQFDKNLGQPLIVIAWRGLQDLNN